MIILFRGQIFPVKWKAFWNLNWTQWRMLLVEPRRAPCRKYKLLTSNSERDADSLYANIAVGHYKSNGQRAGKQSPVRDVYILSVCSMVSLQSITGNVITLRCFSHTFNRVRHALFYAHNAWFTEQPLLADIVPVILFMNKQ